MTSKLINIAAVLLLAAPATATQHCSLTNPTTTPCLSGYTCQAMLGNTAGEGVCVAVQTTCYMNMGQFGCKISPGKSGTDDGCYASKVLCNAAARSTGRSLSNTPRKCNPRSIPLFSGCNIFLEKCEAMVGNNNHEGRCMPKHHPRPTPSPSPQKCSPNNPTTTPCRHGTVCQAMVGNNNGEGVCMPAPTPAAPQKCSPNNPTTTPCRHGTVCQAMVGNNNGEGVCMPALRFLRGK
jgi:hypothetical protein